MVNGDKRGLTGKISDGLVIYVLFYKELCVIILLKLN